MRRFFSENLDGKGRRVRALIGLAFLAGSGFGWIVSGWLGCGLLASGLFVLFEAARGWCVVRACGIRTKL